MYAEGLGDDAWTSEGGTCRPRDLATRARFKDMQEKTNRLASRLGAPQGSTTGDIDPKTVAAVNAILSKSLLLRAKLFSWSYADCTQIAAKADTIAKAFAGELATPIRLPTVVVPPPDAAPAPSSLVDKLKSPVGLAAAGIGAVVLLRLMAKKPAAKRAAKRGRGYRRRTVKRVGRQRVTTTYY